MGTLPIIQIINFRSNYNSEFKFFEHNRNYLEWLPSSIAGNITFSSYLTELVIITTIASLFLTNFVCIKRSKVPSLKLEKFLFYWSNLTIFTGLLISLISIIHSISSENKMLFLIEPTKFAYDDSVGPYAIANNGASFLILCLPMLSFRLRHPHLTTNLVNPIFVKRDFRVLLTWILLVIIIAIILTKSKAGIAVTITITVIFIAIQIYGVRRVSLGQIFLFSIVIKLAFYIVISNFEKFTVLSDGKSHGYISIELPGVKFEEFILKVFGVTRNSQKIELFEIRKDHAKYHLQNINPSLDAKDLQLAVMEPDMTLKRIDVYLNSNELSNTLKISSFTSTINTINLNPIAPENEYLDLKSILITTENDYENYFSAFLGFYNTDPRMQIWKNILNSENYSKLFGHGKNTFHTIYVMIRQPEDILEYWVHDDYLQLFLEEGIFGLTVFIVFCYRVLMLRCKRDILEHDFIQISKFGILALLLHCHVDIPFQILSIRLIFLANITICMLIITFQSEYHLSNKLSSHTHN